MVRETGWGVSPGEATTVLALVLALWGVFRGIIRPHWERSVINVLRKHPAETRDVISTLYMDDVKRRETALAHLGDVAHANAEKLSIVETVLEAHGQALAAVPRFDKTLGEIGVALNTLSDTMKVFLQEQTRHGKGIARIEGQIEHWTGPERRHHPRRATDEPGEAE